ncbi:MAG: lipopolysaccharide kinase InaA family protein [Planctomycetota bacterium]
MPACAIDADFAVAAEQRLRWWWACAPDAALAELAAEIERPPVLGAESLREGERRQVWTLRGRAGGVLLKRFPARGWQRLLSPARHEYLAMAEFCRLGLPTVRPLAFAERRAGSLLRESWFLGRLVVGARTVAAAQREAFERGDQVRVLELARAALAATQQLHAAPWHHRDLHADNLLLTERQEVLITDLHSARRVRRLAREHRLENLTRLLYSMRAVLDLGREDVAELVREYARARGDEEVGLLESVREGLARFERDYLRGRTARCLRNSSGFVAETRHDGRVFRRRDYVADALRQDLLEHERRIHRAAPGLLGESPQSRVTLVPGGRIVKEYRTRGLWPALRQAAGLSRARSAWLGARRCEVLGLPTPRALALVERRGGGALLVTKALSEPLSVRTYLEQFAPGRDAARRRGLADAVGRIVGCLARAGLRHDDLSTKNLLLSSEALPAARDLRGALPAGAPAVQLIDLDNLRLGPSFDRAAVVRMLGQLADVPASVTRADRQRFLRGYARGAGQELPREWLAAALRLVAQRVARRGRRTGLARGRGARLARSHPEAAE